MSRCRAGGSRRDAAVLPLCVSKEKEDIYTSAQAKHYKNNKQEESKKNGGREEGGEKRRREGGREGLPASGLKLRAVPRKTRLPLLSPFQALTSEKSPVMASSMM